MKYIMFEDFSGRAMPVIFPDRIDHGEMREQMPYSKVLSAGYVTHARDGFHCHGKSTTLAASAREEDAEVIMRCFTGNGD